MSIAKLERQPVLPVENCNPRNAGIAGSALCSRLHVCLFLVTVTIIMMSSRGSLVLVILLLMPLIGESIVWRSWALSGSYSLGQWVLVQSSWSCCFYSFVFSAVLVSVFVLVFCIHDQPLTFYLPNFVRNCILMCI